VTGTRVDGLGPVGDDDIRELLASDVLIDRIAERTPPEEDALAADIVAWLDEIDADYRAPASIAAPASRDTLAGRRTGRRRLVVAAACAAVVLAGTGVAAASPGSFLYPAHRVLFGGQGDSQLDAASGDLDQAAAIIRAAQVRNGISAGDKERAQVLLQDAYHLLADMSGSSRRSQLLDRQARLSDALDRLPVLAAPVSRPHTGSSHGADGSGGGVPGPSGSEPSTDPGSSGDTGDRGGSSGSTGSSGDSGSTGESAGDSTGGDGGTGGAASDGSDGSSGSVGSGDSSGSTDGSTGGAAGSGDNGSGGPSN